MTATALPDDKRVVIVGYGAISSLGKTATEIWKGLVAGKSGIIDFTNDLWRELLELEFGPVKLSNTFERPIKAISHITGFDPGNYMGKSIIKRTDRITHLVAAADSQIDHAPLEKIVAQNPSRHGAAVGAGFIGFHTFIKDYEAYKRKTATAEERVGDEIIRVILKMPHRVNPFMIPAVMGNASTAFLARSHKRMGPSANIVTACATGTDSIGYGFRMIRDGYADSMLVGGTEAANNPLVLMHFYTIDALSKRTHLETPSPFDLSRDGFVQGEGAGLLLLTSLAFAKKLDMELKAEIVGYAQTNDAYHETAPSVEGPTMAMKLALTDSRLGIDEIDHINTHGTGTPLNDVTEYLAIRNVFEERTTRIPVTSNKAGLGHLLGAAGAVEAIVSVETILNSLIPPTIHYKTPDPKIGLNVVTNSALKRAVNRAMSNSFGFGGHNGVLVFTRAP